MTTMHEISPSNIQTKKKKSFQAQFGNNIKYTNNLRPLRLHIEYLFKIHIEPYLY